MSDVRVRLRLGIVLVLAAQTWAGCAAPLQRASTSAPAHANDLAPAPVASSVQRARIGVAFGGGSARGIAHVGVIRWMEEHRIPIDLAAGTSMGGLVGGAFATGMDAAELAAFIKSIDWDELFGASTFEYKNIRRKADARAYPSRLEFGLKRGLVPPTALNTGQAVESLLARLTAPYFEVDNFDELPTPFRTVAVDLLTAEPVIISRGSLADAMRATMSLPAIFPPLDVDGRLLVDGGAMNNVPADVVRAMGADRVVAINVGDLSTREGVDSTMFGVVSETIDAMMRASTKRALAAADVVVNVRLEDYGSLDWRRASELVDEGYRAAEARRDELLPLAVNEAEFAAWRQAREARRRTSLPPVAFTEIEGFVPRDALRLNVLLARHVGVPLDVASLNRDLALVGGLDRYQTVTWRLTRDPARGIGLRVRGRVKPYAPPFMMLGLQVENTTSSEFSTNLAARYLAFDSLGSGSELRVDGVVGSAPGLAGELYRPIGSTPLFLAPFARIGRTTFPLIVRDKVVANYQEDTERVGLAAGVNLGADSDLRIAAYYGHASTTLDVGNPTFPERSGEESGADVLWRLDTQDNPVVPRRGVAAQAQLSYVFNGPDVVGTVPARFDASFTQLFGSANRFWSVGPANRLFAYGGLGTSFDAAPLAPDQFALGGPFKLDAYSAGELRGNHYYFATGGFLRRIGRLPDFIGGPVFAGGWLENGDAFNHWRDAALRVNSGAGVVMDTLAGPAVIAVTWGYDGRWRTYVTIGRTFR